MAIGGTWEDCEQIRDLYARYAHTVDLARYDEWIDCFTEDGVFESPRFGRHQGIAGLRQFTAIYRESNGAAQVRHIISNVLFDISGDHATGSCYLNYYHCKDGKTSLSALGRYEDRLRKVNGQWRFESRKVHIDGHG
jgi:3-phenylpropionate/cinnamic acid dioxygenase small subunit